MNYALVGKIYSQALSHANLNRIEFKQQDNYQDLYQCLRQIAELEIHQVKTCQLEVESDNRAIDSYCPKIGAHALKAVIFYNAALKIKTKYNVSNKKLDNESNLILKIQEDESLFLEKVFKFKSSCISQSKMRLLDENLQQEISVNKDLDINTKLFTYYYLIKCYLALGDKDKLYEYLAKLEGYCKNSQIDKELAARILEFSILLIEKNINNESGYPTGFKMSNNK